MSLRHFLRSGRPKFAFYRPILEGLEDRTLLSFITPKSYPAGEDPDFVAVGDLNGDGVSDLAVADQYEGTVTILIGKRDGTFRAGQQVAVQGNLTFLAVADFNGDGHLDLVVDLSVLLGKGDGTFLAPQNYAIDGLPSAIAVGDFNGDGVPDLAVTNDTYRPNTVGQVSILLGNGNGTFRAGQSYPVGPDLTGVGVGDFNGDGRLDLAVGNYGDFGGIDPGLKIFLGNGDGSFEPAQRYAGPGSITSLVVADFNSDGILDIAASTVVTGAGSVTVWLGQGDGSFQVPHRYAAGYLTDSIAVGDFNRDGILDLAVIDPYGTVSTLSGNGDGSFLAPQSYVVSFFAPAWR